jgi:polyketide synthase-associated protein
MASVALPTGDVVLQRPRLGVKAVDVKKDSQDAGNIIAFCLQTKGFCCIGDCCDAAMLEQAQAEVAALDENGRLKQPPELVQDGLLGSDGSAKTADLQLTNPSEEDALNSDGEALGKLDLAMWSILETFAPYQGLVGLECTSRSPPVLHQSGETFDEDVPLSDHDADKWASVFLRQKALVLIFLGAGQGMLELQPYDDDANPIDIMTYPGLTLIIRTDQLSFKYTSPETTSCLSCSFLQDNILRMHSVVRQAHTTPAAEALEEWIQERLKEMKIQETEDTVWGDEVPRGFVLSMNHQFFKIRMTAVKGAGVKFTSTWDSETWFCGCLPGTDCAVEVPYERWDHASVYDPSDDCWQMMPPKTNCRHACFIDGLEMFDMKMFGLSAAEVKSMDPNQRLCLESAYECLHRGGVSKKKMLGSSCGMYVGTSTSEWNAAERTADVGTFGATGGSAAITAGRVSFCLGLKGACLSIDTEAAASLTCTLYAVESVQVKGRGRLQDFAVGMGVSTNLAKAYWPAHSAAGFLCPQGRAFTFDESAQGHIRGEGCGALMVKLLNEKVDGEEIVTDETDVRNVGILAAGASNHNGRTAGLSAPNGPSIQEVLLDSCRQAGIQPHDIDSCELHGSAQYLADAVEVQSANKALRSGSTDEVLLCTAGKTQMGNGIEVAGMFQILKSLYSTQYGASPAQLHLNALNPHIELEDSPVSFPTELLEYRMKSCFQSMMARGFGGMNVNLVSYGTVDEERRPPPKKIPEEHMPKLAYWPSGGGSLMDYPRRGYFITGSWNEWGEGEEMVEEGDGVFGFTVTIGENRWEQFVVMLDNDSTRLLHPNRYKAPKGTMLFGPDHLGLRDSTWLIDGRTEYTAYETIADRDDADGGIVKHDFQEHATGDTGRPGTQYRVRLHVSGKWRTVSWTKVGFKELESPAVGRYSVFGGWNNWSLAGSIEMAAAPSSPGVFNASVTLKQTAVQFLIVRNMDMGQVIYPLAENAGQGAQVVGPDDLMYQTQWLIEGRMGDVFRIELRLGERGPEVRWFKVP